MKDPTNFLLIVGAAWGFWLCVYLLKWIGSRLWYAIECAFLPIERKLLIALQDRASARTLGVDVGRIRARRQIDFPNYRP
jgi:hypothetical protein